jgi:hypothetical protein
VTGTRSGSGSAGPPDPYRATHDKAEPHIRRLREPSYGSSRAIGLVGGMRLTTIADDGR